MALGPEAAKLAPDREGVLPASGNIAGVGRAVYPGTLAGEAGTVVEKQVDELMIVSQREGEIESTAEMQGVELVIVWKTRGGLSAKSGVEKSAEACFVAADGSEDHD